MVVFQLIAYYISSIVGVGILTIPVITYQIAESYSLIAWGLLIFLSIPFASLFAFISIKKPHANGFCELFKVVITVKMPIMLCLISKGKN